MCCLLVGCSKGAEVASKGAPTVKAPVVESDEVEETTESESSSEEPVQQEDETGESAEEETEEEDTSDVTQAPKAEPPKGVAKDECTVDSKGVVRLYKSDGSKVVYRDDCVGGILTEYDCVAGDIRQYNTICPSGVCVQKPYGDQCGF